MDLCGVVPNESQRQIYFFTCSCTHIFYLSFLYLNLLHRNWKQTTSAIQIKCYHLNFYIIAYITTYLLLTRSVVYTAMLVAYHVFKLCWCFTLDMP